MRLSFLTRFARWCHCNIFQRHRIKSGTRKTIFLALLLGLFLWNGSTFGERWSSVLAVSTHQGFVVSSAETPMLVDQSGAVSIISAADAVAKFTPEQQLYVKGNSLTTDQISRLMTTLNANPNVFVVVMDYSADMVADEETLSRGIANSSGFENIQHPITEERQGILFMVYFDSDFGRQIGMRAEELPDRLGVGEKNFADEYDNPLELLTLFRNAVHQEGKDLPGALEVVINRINGTIRQNVEATVGKAQQTVEQVNTAWVEILGKLELFQSEFPNAGVWAKSDVDRWQTQLNQAQTALDQNHLSEAQNQAQALFEEIQSQELRMGQYRETVAESQQLIEQANTILTEILGKLELFQSEFPNAGAWAKPDVDRWQTQLNQAQTALDQNHLSEAQSWAQTLLEEIRGQELQMNQYREAATIAPQLTTTLSGLATEIDSLPQNMVIPLNQLYDQAQGALRNYHVQIQEGQPKFWEALQTAQTKVHTLQFEIQHIQQRLAHQRITLLRGLGGLVATLLTVLLVLWFLAKNARLDADRVLRKASRTLADRTQILLQLMEDAEYHSFNSYTGATATHAKTMLTHLTNALALVGGAEVVMSEVEKLVRHKGLVNYFWSVHCRRAIALLTDANTALPLQKVGNLQVLLKNQEAYIRDVWRSHLSVQTDTDAMNYSFQNILEQMAEQHTTAVELLQELVKKDSGIGDYLSQIEVDSQRFLAQAQSLPMMGETQLASEPWFTVPSTLTVIAPLLLEAQGYIAQGRSIMTTDPINAWDHYGDGAKRIVQEATTVVEIAREGRSQLLTILGQADRALHPFQVSTDWAHGMMQQLSKRLDEAAQESAQMSVVDTLEQIRQEIHKLSDRIQTIVHQDSERRTVAPEKIGTATADVSQARQRLWSTLRSLNLFRTGTPDGVLREADRNPSEHIVIAQTHLDELKALLDIGDEERSKSHLETITAETQIAHQLVTATHAAMDAYPQILPLLKERIPSLLHHLQYTTLPILEDIKRAYVPEVLELVAPEVNAGRTISDNPELATNLINQATEILKTAVEQMDTAHILTATDDLAKVDRMLTGANTQLESVATARQVLAKKQQSILTSYDSLSIRVQQVDANLQDTFVRSKTQQLGDELGNDLNNVAHLIRQTLLNPYAAKTIIQGVEDLRKRVEKSIATDQQAFKTANATIRQAESELNSAQHGLNHARRQHFSYATVRTHDANTYLQDAQATLIRARSWFDSQEYEASIRQAKDSIAEAQRASRAADNAVSRARHEHYAEESRREAETRRTSSSSSFSSSHSSRSSHSSSSSSRSSSSSGSRGGGW